MKNIFLITIILIAITAQPSMAYGYDVPKTDEAPLWVWPLLIIFLSLMANGMKTK